MRIPPEFRQRLLAGTMLSVDPGLLKPAYALWERGKLVLAERVSIPGKYAELERGERERQVAKLVIAAARRAGMGYLLDGLVYEHPQIYRHGRGKGDPNQLVPLASVGAWIAGQLDVPVVAPLPSEWIGQVPKVETGDPWSSPRGKLVIRCVPDPLERARIQAKHDAIDAAGIGLWALRRLTLRIR